MLLKLDSLAIQINFISRRRAMNRFRKWMLRVVANILMGHFRTKEKSFEGGFSALPSTAFISTNLLAGHVKSSSCHFIFSFLHFLRNISPTPIARWLNLAPLVELLHPSHHIRLSRATVIEVFRYCGLDLNFPISI